MRETLINTYLDYVNNYLSIDVYAEHNGLTTDQGYLFIDLAWQVYNSEHPDK